MNEAIRLLKNPLSIEKGDLKMPTPIFVLSLPKSGTSTTYNYFNCDLGTLNGQLPTSVHYRYPIKVNTKHNDVGRRNKFQYPNMLIGTTMSLNVKLGLPLLSNPLELVKLATSTTIEISTAAAAVTVNLTETTILDIYIHYGFNFFELYNNDVNSIDRSLDEYTVLSDFAHYCPELFLQTDALENIATFYPNATLLLVNRDFSQWYNSALNWGSILYQLRTCKGSKLTNGFFERPANYTHKRTIGSGGGKNNTEEDKDLWKRFYHNYETYIRTFAESHPSLTCIEIQHRGSARYI